MRRDQRTTLEGYGNALAGRGSSINTAIEELVPFMTSLEPVMRALSDDETELRNLFPQLRRTAGQIAPVADTYAELFGNMATTFEALSRHEQSLRDTLDRAPDTLEAGIESFPVQRPFLHDSGDLAVKLEPVAEEIERSLPVVADQSAVSYSMVIVSVLASDRVTVKLAAVVPAFPSTTVALSMRTAGTCGTDGHIPSLSRTQTAFDST